MTVKDRRERKRKDMVNDILMPAPAGPTAEELLTEIRDLLKEKE